MKTEVLDGELERRVLVSQATDPVVCGHVAARWTDDGLYRTRPANLFGAWCVRYFTTRGGAPGRALRARYAQWVEERRRDPEQVRQMEDFLLHLDAEQEAQAAGEHVSPDFLLDLAGTHFRRVALERLRDRLDQQLVSGDLDKAEGLVYGYLRPELGRGGLVDVLRDREAIKEAFAEAAEPLFRVPGAYGRLLAPALEADTFFALMGPGGRGKSWLLIDLAWWSLLSRRRTVYVALGDLTRNQMMRRFMTRAARRPRRPPSPERPLRWPTAIRVPPGEKVADVQWETLAFAEPMGWQDAWRACEQVITNHLRTDETLLGLACHPAQSLSVDGLRDLLTREARLGRPPEVVLVDYADLLRQANARHDKFQAIDHTWANLRALADEFHCFVGTATQTGLSSYDAEDVQTRHNTGYFMKIAHAAFLCGISQTPAERRDQVLRINMIKGREVEIDPRRFVHLAGCLGVGAPAVLSAWPERQAPAAEST